MKKAYVTIAAAAISVAILLGATFASFHLTQRPSADNENGALLPDEDGGTLPPAPEPEAPDEKPLPPQEPETDVPVVTIPKDQYVRSKVNGLNIRSAPSTSASSLGYIDKGDMVLLKGKEGNWYETVYKNKPAYVSAGSSYTELFELETSPDSRVEAVIGEGYNLLGFPYVYGATRLHNGNGKFLSGFDKTKYDCSSLMQYMFYYGAGVNLELTTRTQVSQGTHVPRSELSRGDLIFFTSSTRYNKTGVERIGHVALYLGGNYILHTATDYAVIEEISAQRWSYYIETRRMI